MDVRKPNSFQKKTGKIRKVLCIELKKSYLCEVVPLSVRVGHLFFYQSKDQTVGGIDVFGLDGREVDACRFLVLMPEGEAYCMQRDIVGECYACP